MITSLFWQECVAESTNLDCVIPAMDHRDWNSTVVTADYGLLMDGVQAVVNLSARPDLEPLTYHPTPVLHPLADPLKFSKDLTVTIKVCALYFT